MYAASPALTSTDADLEAVYYSAVATLLSPAADGGGEPSDDENSIVT